jgi:hypothetical protein
VGEGTGEGGGAAVGGEGCVLDVGVGELAGRIVAVICGSSVIVTGMLSERPVQAAMINITDNRNKY